MAIVRNQANTLRKGRVGQDTFYVAKGRQVVRQSRNNSNYGVSAARTYSQQVRRAKWGNLVNLYKVMKRQLEGAFETKAPNQSDYNKFMSLNIDSVCAYMTKEQVALGCSVPSQLVVSQGTLPSIQGERVNFQPESIEYAMLRLDVQGLSSVDNLTKLSDFSQAIVDEDPNFQDGDAIIMICLEASGIDDCDIDSRPRALLHYAELVLDTQAASTVTIGDTPFENMFPEYSATPGVFVCPAEKLADPYAEYMFALIHTSRRDGKLLVSPSTMDGKDEGLLDAWTDSRQWQEECVESYGLDEAVPLVPGYD